MEQVMEFPLQSYGNAQNIGIKLISKIRRPLSTKKAVELLLSGDLKKKVCRLCLNIDFPLSELDLLMTIAGEHAFYQVAIRDMLAVVHPYKISTDPNLPSKICEKCLNKVIQSYLLAQQIEQSERALNNYFEDLNEKFYKLDPMEPKKKRGRHKQNPNYNVLYTEHTNVIDYAEPLRHLINSRAEPLKKKTEMEQLECRKCWEILPDLPSLQNHEHSHPKSMWYHCRICGKSFAKLLRLKQHLRKGHSEPKPVTYKCYKCDFASEDINSKLQHKEKHKFKSALKNLIEKRSGNNCAVCLEEKVQMVDIESMVSLHGNYPSLNGHQSVIKILGLSLPEMNIPYNYTSSKVCDKCLEHAIVSYVFINRAHFIRDRLNKCISGMLDRLKDVNEPENKLFIEIAEESIAPAINLIDEALFQENVEFDEAKLITEVLEDKYRLPSESDSEESATNEMSTTENADLKICPKMYHIEKTPIKMNGYQSLNSKLDFCSEFLTFKSKNVSKQCSYKCPVCCKNFVSKYFLSGHLLKHCYMKCQCKICSSYFTSVFLLSEHNKLYHNKQGIGFNSCNICFRAFKSDTKLISHMKFHDLKQCLLCFKIYKTQFAFQSHLKRHSMRLQVLKRKVIKYCSFCEKECANKSDLSIHVNRDHLQYKKYNCNMCDHSFHVERNLKHHRKIHSIYSKETCEFCKKTFKCRKALVIHVKKHIGL